MSQKLLAVPYKSPYAKLEVDDNADDADKRSRINRQCLSYFIRCNLEILLVMTLGLRSVILVVLFTHWLSRQLLACLNWAVSKVSRRVTLFSIAIKSVQKVDVMGPAATEKHEATK